MRRQPALSSFHSMHKFYEDAAKGDLPAYSWVEPRYYDTPRYPASDQHPDHDVSVGDQLIKDMYEALRGGPLWNKTAFIITYDEHGGFFDHVPPPADIPSPDGISSTDDPFDFTRLGVRVPTLVISPWTSKGTVVHAPPSDQGQFDHTSLIATVLHKMFQPAAGYPSPDFLTQRDAWAATFEDLFTMESVPRSDCPLTLPDVPSHRLLFPDSLPPLEDSLSRLVTELQRELLAVAAGSSEDSSFDFASTSDWTVGKAVAYISSRMEIVFGVETAGV
jgi:phospholipase C